MIWAARSILPEVHLEFECKFKVDLGTRRCRGIYQAPRRCLSAISMCGSCGPASVHPNHLERHPI